MLADEVDYVIGVDTHRDQHTLAVVVAPTGAVLAQTVVRATGRGYAQALGFAESQAGGVRVWAIEGAGHYGAGLTRYLADRGEKVLEVGRHARTERRLRGKDDPLDAIRAARSSCRMCWSKKSRDTDSASAASPMDKARRGTLRFSSSTI